MAHGIKIVSRARLAPMPPRAQAVPATRAAPTVASAATVGMVSEASALAQEAAAERVEADAEADGAAAAAAARAPVGPPARRAVGVLSGPALPAPTPRWPALWWVGSTPTLDLPHRQWRLCRIPFMSQSQQTKRSMGACSYCIGAYTICLERRSMPKISSI